MALRDMVKDLWDALLGKKRPSKTELIRSLLKQRMREDSSVSTMAIASGIDERTVDTFEIELLAGLPECTIVTNVETYAALKRLGMRDEDIFARIEAHRASIGSGEMPKPLNLESYIQYRVDLEHKERFPISSEFVAKAIRISRHHYRC